MNAKAVVVPLSKIFAAVVTIHPICGRDPEHTEQYQNLPDSPVLMDTIVSTSMSTATTVQFGR
jgi:hypothetical protein